MKANVWERAKEALRDLCEYQPEAAELLAEVERVECVEDHIITRGKYQGRACLYLVLPEEER